MSQSNPEFKNFLQQYMQKVGKEIPEIMQGFSTLHQKAVQDGALSLKTKELIALGIAVTLRCKGCITLHVSACLDAGATRQEIMETIGTTILMGGGPSLMYACEALKALEEFEAEKKS
jgi:AhpD family alkylhydroperoxidase